MSNTINNEEVEFDADVFDSMVYGTFEEPAEEVAEEEDVESVEDEADTAEDFEEEEDEYQEDTDQEDESEDEEELDEDGDGDADEDLEEDDEDEEEDSLVEDYDSDEDDSDTEDEEEEADEADDSEDEDAGKDEASEDETDTEEQSDGDAQDTDGVDYKAFYDAVVNTEFVVNGKKVKGFADPQKIIQSQQMAGGFAEKMAGFKQYRPYMAPLRDRGMLEDQAKFDLAMDLIDGDKEAIKKHLASLEIDPLDLDMETIAYEGKSNVATQEALAIEDALERARLGGYDDKLRHVIGKEWDADSFAEFTDNPAVRNDLMQHIETGVYDTVQDKMLELSRLDFDGTYSGMRTIDKYRLAVRELQASAPAAAPVRESVAPVKVKTKQPSVKAEKAKIEKARKEEAYKEKAAKRKAEIAQKRKKAASMSKKKPKAKPKAKFDPLALEGEEFDKHMEFLISGGRG